MSDREGSLPLEKILVVYINKEIFSNLVNKLDFYEINGSPSLPICLQYSLDCLTNLREGECSERNVEYRIKLKNDNLFLHPPDQWFSTGVP